MTLLRALFAGALGAVAIAAAPDAASTKQLYTQTCSVCHGADATGTDRGPGLAGNRRLRQQSAASIAKTIHDGSGGMPAFPLPPDQLGPLADYIHSLNATAFEAKPEGDAAAGEKFFFGAGNCSSCHTVAGRGGSSGPDLSGIARQLTLPELEESLTDPGARIAPGYGVST